MNVSPRLQRLIDFADAAKERSYSPYSKFRVGAALEHLSSDLIIPGTNVENASYGLTCCAERSAIFAAVSEGVRRFKAIVVVSDEPGAVVTGPCGACRQVLYEFGPMWVIGVGQPAGDRLRRETEEWASGKRQSLARPMKVWTVGKPIESFYWDSPTDDFALACREHAPLLPDAFGPHNLAPLVPMVTNFGHVS